MDIASLESRLAALESKLFSEQPASADRKDANVNMIQETSQLHSRVQEIQKQREKIRNLIKEIETVSGGRLEKLFEPGFADEVCPLCIKFAMILVCVNLGCAALRFKASNY